MYVSRIYLRVLFSGFRDGWLVVYTQLDEDDHESPLQKYFKIKIFHMVKAWTLATTNSDGSSGLE